MCLEVLVIRQVWEVIIQFVAGRKRVLGSRISYLEKIVVLHRFYGHSSVKIFTFSLFKCTKISNAAFF